MAMMEQEDSTTPVLRSSPPRHICIYGLTAAGKTTHATLLAQQLNMDYVSASQLMFSEIGYRDKGQNDTWTHHAAEISEARASGTVDEAVNRQLLVLAESSTPTVFDSWTLPYMTRESELLQTAVFFLRLDSDVNSRAVKCLVSQGANSSSSIGAAIRLVKDKDMTSRETFSTVFGFDILSRTGGPRSSKKAQVDLSPFVFGSSPHQVRRGIWAAHDQIEKKLSATWRK